MEHDTAIQFDHVSKRYIRGQKLLLKEALLDVFRPGGKNSFLALDDVSFTIKKGEKVGIIGTNGSGKSTTLKLIAGVTQPTKGSVKVAGRISPLIELGAGFHGELSGRENIYLNGTILGLTKKEIDAKIAEIIDFAELQDFIDSPVKHYSSGMYMRLGFSIAVAVNPEILLIDEIFAVGDTGFQEKCIRKMIEFHNQGVTIVLVSHSLDIVSQFCERAILIQHGKLLAQGLTQDVISEYQHLLHTQ